jgi:hypothetical protein
VAKNKNCLCLLLFNLWFKMCFSGDIYVAACGLFPHLPFFLFSELVAGYKSFSSDLWCRSCFLQMYFKAPIGCYKFNILLMFYGMLKYKIVFSSIIFVYHCSEHVWYLRFSWQWRCPACLGCGAVLSYSWSPAARLYGTTINFLWMYFWGTMWLS